MARETVVTLIDDLDGSEAEVTTTFGIDGDLYSIDLSGANDDRLRAALAKFIIGATPLGRARLRRQRNLVTARGAQEANRDQNRAIRVWAAANGYAVSPRGRIAEHVVTAFEKAHVS